MFLSQIYFQAENAERTRKAAEERESERREMMVRDEFDIEEAGAAALIEHDADEVEIPFMLSLLKHDDSQ